VVSNNNPTVPQIKCDDVERMCDAFLDVAQEVNAQPDEMMAGITELLLYQLSLLCPQCRKQLLKQFKRLLPKLLVHAAAKAANNNPHEHACH
jgi:hypothetical protein